MSPVDRVASHVSSVDRVASHVSSVDRVASHDCGRNVSRMQQSIYLLLRKSLDIYILYNMPLQNSIHC